MHVRSSYARSSATATLEPASVSGPTTAAGGIAADGTRSDRRAAAAAPGTAAAPGVIPDPAISPQVPPAPETSGPAGSPDSAESPAPPSGPRRTAPWTVALDWTARLGDRFFRFAWPPPPWQSLASAAIVLTVIGLLGLAVGGYRGSIIPTPLVALEAALVLGFLPAGLLAVRRRPRGLSALLIAAVGLLALTGLTASAWSGAFVGSWFAHWTWWPPIALLPVVVLCFPTAPRTDALRRWVDVSAFAAATGTACLLDAAAVSPDADLFTASRQIGGPAMILSLGWLASALVGLVAMIVALATLVSRRRRARGATRRWAMTLVPALAVVPVAALLTVLGVPLAYLLPVPVLGWGLAAGLLPDPQGRADRRWQLGLTAVVAVALLVLLAGAALVWGPGLIERYPALVPWSALVLGIGLIAATARWWLAGIGGAVARLRYGRARAAYRTLRETPSGPATTPTLGRLVESVAEVLPARGVCIRARIGEELVTVAQVGDCEDPECAAPIDDGTQQIGSFEAGLAEGTDALDEDDLATLRRAARRAAPILARELPAWTAVHARARVAARREAERDHVRTELQETFGPSLTACRRQLEAARLRMPSQRTAALLDPVIDDLTGIAETVQELMEELRPAALERGLVRALHEAAAQRLPGVAVTIDVAGDLQSDGSGSGSGCDGGYDGGYNGGYNGDGGRGYGAANRGATIPAEVQSTAYRIIAQALTWAAERDDVRTVRVTLTAEAGETLTLVVLDDGTGSSGSSAGDHTGDPTAMRAWAEDVGGRVTVLSSDTGTRVGAVLPLPHTMAP